MKRSSWAASSTRHEPAMKVTVKMSGFKELTGSLSMINVAGRVRLEKAVDTSSAAILSGAQARVPVGSADDPHAGDLKKSLRRKISSSGMSAAIMAGFGQMARKGRAKAARTRGEKVNVGKGVYAPAVEFGSEGKPAEPFLYPALNAEAPAFVARCSEAMGQAIGDAVKKGGV